MKMIIKESKKRSKWAMLVMIGMVCGLLPAVVSAEPETQASKSIVPTNSASATTQKVMIATGSIATLDTKSEQPSIALTTTEGKTLTIALDSKTTTVWKEEKEISWNMLHLGQPDSQLKMGDRIKIRYTMKDGKNLAKSIEIVKGQPSV